MTDDEGVTSCHGGSRSLATGEQNVWNAQLFVNRPSSSTDLEDLLGIYNDKRRQKDPDISNCTWQNVLDKIHEAQKNYQDKGQRSSVRGFFRHGKSIQMTITPLLEVIPEDYGLRTLKGGLTLLFSCLAERQGNVEKIFRCFEDVPLVMENARETLEIFQKNPKLCDHVWDLYHALITGIPALIEILLGKSDSKWWSHFRHKMPAQQERVIEDTISRVENAKRKLSEYAETVGYQSVADIEQITTRTAGQVSTIQLDIQEMSNGLKMEFWGVMQALQGINKVLYALQEESIQQRKQITELTESTKQNKCIHVMHSAVYQIGQETLHHRPLDAPPLRPRITAPNRPTGAQHVAYIASICGGTANPNECLHSTADIRQIVSKKYQFDEESIGRSRWLMTSGRFQNWLTSPQPGALAVHSYTDMISEGKTSAMSIFCATLASALIQQREHVIVLSFFCGLHASPKDKFHGPFGILRSLLLQLLMEVEGMGSDDSSTGDVALMQDLEDGIPDALAYVFRQCALQLSSGTRVFCLIDGADVYDTRRNGWRNALGEVFRLLGSVVSSAANRSSFNFLVATPARSDIILQEMSKLDSDWFPSLAIDMSAGEVDSRPLTEGAIIRDMVGPRKPR